MKVRVVDSTDALPKAWDRLDHGPSPFLRHGFLRALEESGSIDPPSTRPGRRSGWTPAYLLVEDGDDLLGGVAAFLKTHSYGEYIFDFGWANAAMRAGLPYYPKLVIAAPGTPATGRRLLLAPALSAAQREHVIDLLVSAARQLAEAAGASSIHWLFCTAEEQAALADRGFIARASLQFHWHNQGYRTFDDFLARLRSRRRKQLRKERGKAQAQIDGLEWRRGGELDEAELDDLDRWYRTTTDNHGGRAYMRPGFFHRVAALLPDETLVATVRRGGRRIAGALFFQGDRALYGRYWGTDEPLDCLHFETAYYAGIDRCIEHGLTLFEAGAQGEHKLLRGFAPAPTYSAHGFRHPGLADAVAEHCLVEAEEIRARLRELAELGPYHVGDDEP
ncbi:MAG: GNAT family N-acetyltransferase [Kofleriaceae bacterium]